MGGVELHEEGGRIDEVNAFGFAEHLGVCGVDEFEGSRIEATPTHGNHRFDSRSNRGEGGKASAAFAA